MRTAYIILLIALVAGSAIAGQGTVNSSLRCEVNWKSCFYVVETQASVQNPKQKASRDKAVENARKSAINKMMALISQTSIAGKNSAPVIAKNPVLKKKIAGIVSGTKAASTFVAHGAKTVVVVSLKIPVFGVNAPGSLIINNSTKPANTSDAIAMDGNQCAVMSPVNSAKPPAADNNCSGYTSVVLDATGFKVHRCMNPRVLKACGDQVWDGSNVSTDLVEEFGITAYSKSLDAANKNPRCGLRPLIIKVINVSGMKGKDVIISDDDAKLLLDENLKWGFLDKLNVIIVSD